MLSTANITMQFGPKPLFENISVKFGDGNRYGLIGANGCGKSTFMKILGGDLEPSAGNVMLDPGERLGKLRQDQFAFEEMRVLDVVMMGHTEMWAAMSDRDAIYANPDATDDDYMKAADLEAKFAEYDGYTAEARAGELLAGVGIPIAQHQGLMSSIAPGFKLRVLLAQALFSNPDILLLDEPTNNLDINTIRWLEDVLNQRNSTMIIISHDRHFLNQVCTHMADMDYGTLKVYPGNYDDYMLASTQARAQQMSANAKAKEKVAELQDFVRRFSANKSKARQATSRAKQIDKIKIDDFKPSSRQNPFIRFEGEKKLHRLAVETQSISKAYDHPLFKNFSIAVEAGEKIAIIGANGAGKTTLFRMIMNEEQPDGGSIRIGETVKIGYVDQRHKEIDADKSVYEVISGGNEVIEVGGQTINSRAYCSKFNFQGADQQKKVSVLSGGERNRLHLAMTLKTEANVLLLDEPTNDIDVNTLRALEEGIQNFAGCAVVISHDRWFLDRICTHILAFEGDSQAYYFEGDFSEYEENKKKRLGDTTPHRIKYKKLVR